MPTAKIIPVGGKLKSFHPRSGTRQECLLLLPLLNIIVEVLARATRQERDTKGIKIGKKEVNLCLFTDDIILHVGKAKESPQNC